MLNETEQLQISLCTAEDDAKNNEYNLDRIIFDLNTQIDTLTSQADNLDYIVSVAAGIICGALDVLWVGEFDLSRGREIASDKIDNVNFMVS